MASLKDMEEKGLKGTEEYKKQKEMIDKVCYEYAGNDMKKLKVIVIKCIKKYGISYDNKKYVEFLSDANWQLYMILRSFDPEKNDSIYGYTDAKLSLKVITTLRDVSRQKYVNYERDENGKVKVDDGGNRKVLTDVSIDNENEDNRSVLETYNSGFDIHSATFGEQLSDNYYEYMKRLGKKQRRVAIKIGEGYKISEIAEILHMSKKEVSNCMKDIKDSNNVRVFYKSYRR